MVLNRAALPQPLCVAFGVVALLYLQQFPLNHDVAWLLEATRRWVAGERLYVDIVEINPPLIFLENIILTAGVLTKQTYLFGVTLVCVLSGLWVGRWHGAGLSLAATAVLICAGVIGFGQRDHLALIFLLPFLMAPDELDRPERVALAAYAFLGAGLKPYFLLMPGAFVAARCLEKRSFLPAWALQNIVLSTMIGAWTLTIVVLWPTYLSEIVPMGRFVYSAFGQPVAPTQLNASVAILVACLLVSVRHAPQRPLAAATLGALLSFVIQGRFWPYHLIPAIGLAAVLTLQAGWQGEGLLRLALLFCGAGFTVADLVPGPRHYPKSLVPRGVHSVLFLADAVPVAYPMVVECGIRNASRYPTFWTLPGAWNAMDDPDRSEEAWQVFRREVKRGNQDIRKYQPEIIFEEIRPPKFRRQFHFSDWFDLSAYRNAGQRAGKNVWLRRDLSLTILDRETCQFT